MTKASDNMTVWRVLRSVARGEGLCRAAESLEMDPAFVSRLIRHLEKEIGFALTERGVRPLQLTHEARNLLGYVDDLAFAHERLMAAAEAAGGRSRPMTLRIGVPVNIFRGHIYQFIKQYRKRDPMLTVEMRSDADHEDVINGRVEIGYLPYRPPVDGLLVREIIRAENCLLATPEYLAEHGRPTVPHELEQHMLILRRSRHYPETKMLVSGERTEPLVCRGIACQGDVPSCMAALLSHEGIAVDLSVHVLRREIEEGRVEPVLPSWHRPSWSLCLVVARTMLGNTRLVNFFRAFHEAECRAALQRLRYVRRLCGRDEIPEAAREGVIVRRHQKLEGVV